MDKTNLLKGVENTLYIPLVARIYASEKFPYFFHDEKALSLKHHIPENDISKNSNEYSYMASVCRQKTIDGKIMDFLGKNIHSNIVFLGSGLETAYHRLNHADANFYEVDLPDVINIRKELLGNAENEELISGDMFGLDWINEIDVNLPSMIVASGVFQYFDESKIIEMIDKMRLMIPKGELVFDATNSKGLKLANKYVRKTGNLDAQMHFSIDNPTEFSRLTKTKLVEIDGFFHEALKDCRGLKMKTRIYMYFADKLNRTFVVHLKFN